MTYLAPNLIIEILLKGIFFHNIVLIFLWHHLAA